MSSNDVSCIIGLATSNAAYLTDATPWDLVLAPLTSSNAVRVGCQGSNSSLCVSGSNVSVQALAVVGSASINSNLTVATGLATFSNVNFTGALTQNGAPFVSGGGGGGGGTAGVLSVESNYSSTILNTSNTWTSMAPQTRYFPNQALAVNGSGVTTGRGGALDASGGIYVSGTYATAAPTIYNAGASSSGQALAAPSGTAAFLTKYSAAGAAQWGVSVCGSGAQTGTSAAVDSAGNAVLAGTYSTAVPSIYDAGAAVDSVIAALPAPLGGTTAFVAKYNSSGQAQWATAVDGPGNDSANAVAADTAGAVVVVGSYVPQATPKVYENGTVGSNVAAGIAVFAGSGTATFANGTGTAASFKAPYGVAVDSSGNVFVAEQGGHRIRKITSTGVVTTFAGSGNPAFINGNGTGAWFQNPNHIALDSSGNMYVADTGNCSIRKITSAGVVTTLAGDGTPGYVDGTGGGAEFQYPSGVAVDSSGNVYVADTNNQRIRKITSAGVVTTLAGNGTPGFANGTGSGASFNVPMGIAVDSAGNIYVSERDNNRIRKITSGGVVTTFAGSGVASYADGTGSSACFNGPNGISIDSNGNVYVAEWASGFIRKITSAGVVTSVANGTYLYGIAVNATGSLIYAAGMDNNIVKWNAASTTVVGTVVSSNVVLPVSGSASSAAFAVKYNSSGVSQWSVAVDGAGADSASSVATDPSNNVFIAGSYGSSVPSVYSLSNATAITPVSSSAGSNAFGAKISAAGAPQWIVSTLCASNSQALDCAADSAGNFYLAGTYSGTSATVYNAGAAASALTLPSTSNTAAFLVAYNSSGAAQWETVVDRITASGNVNVGVDSQRNVFLTGAYSNGVPFVYGNGSATPSTVPTFATMSGAATTTFVAKFNSNGVPLAGWSATGTSNLVSGKVLPSQSSSNVTLVGSAVGSSTLYDGNAMVASGAAFPAGMTTQGAYAATYATAASHSMLPSSLGTSNAGQLKYVTNTGASTLTLDVTSSNNATVLNSYAVAAGATTTLGWLGSGWYKFA